MDDLKLKQKYLQLLAEKEKRKRFFKLGDYLHGDKFLGPYPKTAYPKHIDFMNKGKQFRQRAFVAGNRVAKSYTGALELTFHMTGRYPDDWQGRRFNRPISAWSASVTADMLKSSVQEWLFVSNKEETGTGLVPFEDIKNDNGDVMIWMMPGVPNCVGSFLCRHYTDGVFDGFSKCEFKTYAQGWASFQGAKRDLIWLDEDPACGKLYSECLMRLASRPGEEPGILICTFTPTQGLSEVVVSFMPGGLVPEGGLHPEGYKFVTQVSWNEVPHLTEEEKKELLAGTPEHLRDAREKGIPYLGQGAIFPYNTKDICCSSIPLQPWWPRAYGFDVGWNCTAAVWGAIDPDTNKIYIYSEYKKGKEIPAVHASAIKSLGSWIPGAIDPRGADNRSQIDGTRLIDLYDDEGLILVKANNGVESSILRIKQLFESGQLKIFDTCKDLIAELRLYRRNDSGEVVKENDHLIDAFRYFVMTGIDHAELPPDVDARESFNNLYARLAGNGERSPVTGY